MGKMFEVTPPKPSSSTTPNENVHFHQNNSNDHSEMTSNLTSSSSEFQIISPNSSPVNGTCNNMHLNDLQLSVYSAHFDLTPEEIDSKLRELLRENLELKEIIHENNVAMNDQCERLALWQEEVKLVHRQHKKKFEETRNVIERLHAQNMELQEKLQKQIDDQKTNTTTAEEIDDLRKQLLEKDKELEKHAKENERLSILELQMRNELTTVTENLERVKVERSRTVMEKQELVAINNDLQIQLEALKQSANQMSMNESCLETNENIHQGFVVVQQKQIAPPQKENSAKVQNTSPFDSKGIQQLLQQLQAQEKVSALMEELIEERKTKALIQKELSELKQSISSVGSTGSRMAKQDEVKSSVPSDATIMSSPPFEQGASMMLGLKESESKLNAASEHMQRYKEKCGGLEKRLSDCQDRLESMQMKDGNIIQQLHLEIADLRQTLAREQAANQQDKASLTEARCQFETLLRDYQELLRSWEAYEQNQANRMPGMQSVAYYEIQLKGLKEQIDSLTAQLVASEETVAAKMDEMNRIRSQLRTCMDEADKIPILQAQVEVYQADFRTERESREKLQQDKEQAVRALHDLQTRYQQLNDEVQMYRQGGSRTASRPGMAFSRPNTGNEAIGGYRFESSEPSASSSRQHAGYDDRRQRVESTILQNGLVMSSSISKMPVRSQTAYFCPKCNRGFKDLQPLENHVNYCLDNDDPFQ